MAPAIVSKRGFLALVLWVLKGRTGYRVIIRIETGHSNLVSCFGPRIRALARYFTSAFASVKYLSQRPHHRAKTWHKIWMTGPNPTSKLLAYVSEHLTFTWKWIRFKVYKRVCVILIIEIGFMIATDTRKQQKPRYIFYFQYFDGLRGEST